MLLKMALIRKIQPWRTMTTKPPVLLTDLEQQLVGEQGRQKAQELQEQLQQMSLRIRQEMAKGLSTEQYELYQAGNQACLAAVDVVQHYLRKP